MRLPSKELLDLLFLHRARRDEFQKLIETDIAFLAGNAKHYICTRYPADSDNRTWGALKLRMVLELDKRLFQCWTRVLECQLPRPGLRPVVL